MRSEPGGATRRIRRGAISGAFFVPSVTILTPLFTGSAAKGDPTLPSIGSDNFTIPGLVNDSSETLANDNTNAAAILDAIATCAAGGGGTITVPAGTYYTNGMYVPTGDDGVNLQIDGTLAAASQSNWVEPNGENAVIYWSHPTNDEISGEGGTVYGQGESWWGSSGAPTLVKITDASSMEVDNLTFTNSPASFFTFGGGSTNNFTFNEVTINAPGTSPGTDGIDPTGNNFLITNSMVSTGGDDISPKAEAGDSPATNVAITNDYIGSGHGLSLGTSSVLGMNNITVNNVTFNGTFFGLRMKSQADNGGVVQNVSFNNITMTNVFVPIIISSWYDSSGGFNYAANANSAASYNSVTNGPYTNGVTPLWQNFSFNNVTSSWTSTTGANYQDSIAGLLYGLPSAVIQNVNFNNVNLSAYQGMSLAYAGTSTGPISFSGNWSINVGTGQQFGTLSNPDKANIGGSNNGPAGNPGSLTYWDGTATIPYDGYPPTTNFNAWETSNVVDLLVPEPTTVSLGIAGGGDDDDGETEEEIARWGVVGGVGVKK